MSDIPANSRNRRHRILLRATWISWAFGMIVTALGFTSPWVPVFDLINEARPLNALAAILLFAIAARLRDGRLIRPAASLALLQAGLLLLPWARAADNAPSLPPALRLVTFDLGQDNDRFDEIADFVIGTNADVVVLQEVSCRAVDQLIPKLKATYANASGVGDRLRRPGPAGEARVARRRPGHHEDAPAAPGVGALPVGHSPDAR